MNNPSAPLNLDQFLPKSEKLQLKSEPSTESIELVESATDKKLKNETVSACLRSKQLPTLLSFDKLPKRQKIDYQTQIDALMGQKESQANNFDDDDESKNADIHTQLPNDLINSSENMKIMSAPTD